MSRVATMAGGRPRTTSWPAEALLAIVLGIGWGWLCWWGDSQPLPLYGLVNIGGPWLLLAFSVGSVSRSSARGALWGALALAIGVIAYYAFMDGLDPVRAVLPSAARGWLLAALAAGLACGALGAIARSRRAWLRVPAVALVAGALLAEATLLALEMDGFSRTEVLYLAVPAGEALVALGLPVLLLRSSREAIAAFVLALAVVPVGQYLGGYVYALLHLHFNV